MPLLGSLSDFFLIDLLLLLFFWLCWVFVSVRGLSPVAVSGGHSSWWCADLSLSWPLLLQSTGSRCAGSAVVAHGPSRSAAYGILPDQGSNPCPPNRQADSQPLCHQGSPLSDSFKMLVILLTVTPLFEIPQSFPLTHNKIPDFYYCPQIPGLM